MSYCKSCGLPEQDTYSCTQQREANYEKYVVKSIREDVTITELEIIPNDILYGATLQAVVDGMGR
jgi:hypothetical protein